MAVFKCKMCGGTIEFKEGATVGVCESCGTKQTFPRLDDERKANLYDRANHFRRNNEFDKAAAIYEQILNEDTTDAEAYWSLVLCNYGIEYVKDPSTKRRVPTINRAQFTSIFDDDNYKSAIEYADSAQRELYVNEAKAINDIQKGILAISQKEEPFDVFICYKETDNNGRRTPDSVLANDLYHQLVQEGFKVFFARITLEDKLGTAYEPYIFAALNSAKVMVVLGTKAEYFNAVWVKNEWSRYLSLVKKSDGKKILIPAYKDMDPYDLPDEFSHLQDQDMSKLGFMQDLIRGIKKIAKADIPEATVKETVAVGSDNKNVTPLLERVFLFLEDCKWRDASIYCEKVLDINPKNAEAYLGKLMAGLQVKSRKELADLAEPFDNNENYAKVIRFADEKLEKEVRGYIEYINERNENERLSNIYDSAIRDMNVASTEEQCKMAAEKFKSISGFKDADEFVSQCMEKAEVCRKDKIYWNAKDRMTTSLVGIGDFEFAIKEFKKISGWRDSDEQISICNKKIEELKIEEEKNWIKREEDAKKLKRFATIAVVIGTVCCVIYVLVNTFILIPQKYNRAMSLIESKDYEQAYTLLNGLNYKDSSDKLKEIETQLKKVLFSKSQVGTYVYFGSYEQDNNTSNGKEDIAWKVLAKEGNRVLLISKFVLDCKPYNTTRKNVTWETSTLRTWLNGEFANAAFSSEDMKIINISTVTADNNPTFSTSPGNNTNDKIFLLSIKEANQYFNSYESKTCKPTKYAISQNVDVNRDGNSFWWLRSPGSFQEFAAIMYYVGELDAIGGLVDDHLIGVRPALWVDISNIK